MELDLLEEEQVFGDNKLDIFNVYGTKAAITDFAILLGGYVSPHNHTDEGNYRIYRTGYWWTKSYFEDNNASVVEKDGNSTWHNVNFRRGGARPALPYSLISFIPSNRMRGNSGIKEVEYGEYPQWVVPENISSELERAYNNKRIRITGKKYTTDSIECGVYIYPLKPRTHTEYEYNGNKYIRFVGDSNCDGKILSDGRQIKCRQSYWVKVEPIVWLVDEKKDIAITKSILVSGIQFNNTRDYKGDFKSTDMYKFMNTYMVQDMFDNISLNNINKEEAKDKEFKSIDNKMSDIKKRIRRLQER